MSAKPVMSSVRFSEMLGRRHDSVLRAIRGLPVTKEFFKENFIEVSGVDHCGRSRPIFHLTDEGVKLLEARSIPFVAQSKRPGLYVILFSTGVVKVGKSKSPEARISQHKSECFRYGVSVISSFFTDNTIATEKELIKYAAARSEQYAGKEYFIGADYDAIVNWLSIHEVASEISEETSPEARRIDAAQRQQPLDLEPAA